MTQSKIMNTAEIAEEYRMSVQTIRSRIKQNKFPKPMSHTRGFKWKRSIIEAFFNEQ